MGESVLFCRLNVMLSVHHSPLGPMTTVQFALWILPLNISCVLFWVVSTISFSASQKHKLGEGRAYVLGKSRVYRHGRFHAWGAGVATDRLIVLSDDGDGIVGQAAQKCPAVAVGR